MKRWLFAGVLGASLVLASAAVAATVFMTPSNMHGWTPNHDSCGAVPSTGSQGFVNGPGDPPGPGTGSSRPATSYSCCCWRRRWIR